MKQYLWAGIAVLLVSAHASDNPFDLKENFGKLDKEQEVLLSELKRLAELKELAEEQAPEETVTEEVTEKEEVAVPTPVVQKVENNIAEPLDAVVEKESASSENKLDTMRQNALDASKEAFNTKVVNSDNVQVSEAEKEEQEKQALLAAVKQKEIELEQIRAEELRKIEAKKEAERREVEAYEKQRAEKLAQKKAEEAAALEKEALAQKEAKKKQKEAKKKQEEAKKQMLKKVKVAEVKKDKKSIETSLVDINVTREKEEAKIAADKAYEEAVKEMNEED